MYEEIYHVFIGLIIGIGFMLSFIGLDKKDSTVFWFGLLGFLIGSYLFITM